MIIFLVGGALATVGSAMTARHQAGVAADLGALAGARALADGLGERAACDRASRIAEANGGRLDGCRASGNDLVITVAVGWRGLAAKASSRAGPS